MIGVLSIAVIVLAVAPLGGAAATAAGAATTTTTAVAAGKGAAGKGVAGATTTTTTAAGKAAAKETTTTTTTVPRAPVVASSLTDGQTITALLSQAEALDSTGVDTSGVRSAIALTQQALDQEAVTVRQLHQAAAQAEQRANILFTQAHAAAASYASLDGALKQAVLSLYVRGTSSLTVNPNAGNALAYAIDYADTAITPNGLLATRGSDARNEAQALAEARKAAAAADRATAAATAEVAAEQSEQARLLAALSSMSAKAASQAVAAHAALASQAGTELRSSTSLQFTPKNGMPAPLTTTEVALEWAFAELGKPYVWGATGPNSFDCSGLTQFVWRQAGVAIPRVAAAQYAWTIPVPLSQLLPGDLVFYGTTDIHHVGIYIGAGLMINAPHTGTVVQVSSIWWSDLAGFGRVHAAGTPVPAHQPPSLADPATPVVVTVPGPVPSQGKPPPGWKPGPGSSTPLAVYPGTPTPPAPPTTAPPPTTSTTAAPPPSTTQPTPTTSPTTSTTTASTTTTSTSTTTTSSVPPG